MIKATIITIGSELLKGTTLDTNSHYLSRHLVDEGVAPVKHTSCDDEILAITASLKEGLTKSDIVFLSGGLGPTPDDITRDAIAQYFKVPLQFSASQFKKIQKVYQKHGQHIPESVKKEALYPKNAKPLLNSHGIALGFTIWTKDKKLIVVLPGVPRELQKMYQEQVKSIVKKKFKGLKKIPSLTAKIIGYSEPRVLELLGESFFDQSFEFGIYPYPGEVIIRIYSSSSDVIASKKKILKNRFGVHLYTLGQKDLSQALGDVLIRNKRTLAVAESCTGGLVAKDISRTAGCSQYFRGGMVVYHNDIKMHLGVKKEMIKTRGAVSEEVAQALSQLIRKKFKSDFGIGVSGIAGPTGGTKMKPVGTVFIAVSNAKRTYVKKYLLHGDREQVQMRAAAKALTQLWMFIHDEV